MRKSKETLALSGKQVTGWRRILRSRLLAYPLLFLVLLGAVHLAGFREQVLVLSGTGVYAPWPMFQGVAYLLLYFASVILAPIMLLAFVMLSLFKTVSRRLTYFS